MAVLALAGCLPIPDVRLRVAVETPQYRIAPERVRTTWEMVDGAVVPGTPEELNRTGLLRYHADERSPQTVIVLVPGLFGGAASMDPLARQLVATVPGLEVWSVDRRANALEDRSGLRRAIAARDPYVALEYYLTRRGEEDGFVPLDPADVPFMATWGLDVHLRDLDAVVRIARSRAERVVLGGHSLGASMVSLYASFRGVRGGEAGQDLVDGLILLDGTLGRTGAFRIGEEVAGLLGTPLLPDAAAVREGRFPPFLDGFLPPRYFARRAVVALLGWYRPDQEAPESLASFPMSNLALAGTYFDDDTYALPIFSPSVGNAVGASYAGNLPAFLLVGARGARTRSLAGVAPGVERIGWSSGDPADEHTDLRQYLRGWTHPAADYNEWYFPLALVLEMTELDAALADRPGFLPTAEVTVPTIGFGGQRGLVADLDGFTTYANLRYGSAIATYVLPDFTHIDVVTAADNPVVPIVARWLERTPPLP